MLNSDLRIVINKPKNHDEKVDLKSSLTDSRPKNKLKSDFVLNKLNSVNKLSPSMLPVKQRHSEIATSRMHAKNKSRHGCRNKKSYKLSNKTGSNNSLSIKAPILNRSSASTSSRQKYENFKTNGKPSLVMDKLRELNIMPNK